MERKGQRHWSKIDLEKLRHVRKDQLLIFFLVGVLLLVIALPSGTKEKEKDSRHSEIDGEEAVGTQAEEQDYARYLERRLEETLSQLDGAGNVRVMVTLQSSAQKIVEKDTQGERDAITEEDSQGGRRTSENTSHQETTVYEGMGEKSQEPYVSKELTPRVEGVVVLAEGGENALVKRNITEAIQALFGIDTHKIRIMKKNETM
ncbi:stage III sporulation protein AG [Dorea sp. ICN-14282]|uniref:stage III sporulation protein AG n=1 Tax=Dorea sp. ICN-14282 TaxID=3134654 RepID=UPI0030C30BFF